MGDTEAQKIVRAALHLRRTHPGVPTLDVLDLVMRGHRGSDPNFSDDQGGNHTMPPAPFARLLRDAFDPGILDSEITGEGFSSLAMADRWEAVLDRFAERYQTLLP